MVIQNPAFILPRRTAERDVPVIPLMATLRQVRCRIGWQPIHVENEGAVNLARDLAFPLVLMAMSRKAA